MTLKSRYLISKLLNGLWTELDQYQNLKMSKAYATTHVEAIEREIIFKFQHGMNHEYVSIKV